GAAVAAAVRRCGGRLARGAADAAGRARLDRACGILTAMAATLADPDTPFAALDRSVLERNVRRLGDHLDALGVPLRLHVKTAKSVEVASVVFGGATGPITVSTLAEAEQFADAG